VKTGRAREIWPVDEVGIGSWLVAGVAVLDLSQGKPCEGAQPPVVAVHIFWTGKNDQIRAVGFQNSFQVAKQVLAGVDRLWIESARIAAATQTAVRRAVWIACQPVGIP
jgi:hypothetical protein